MYVIDMATDPIDVGGIIYRMDGSPSVNYMYRSIHDFVKTFEPISKKTGIPLPTIQKLFQKYMNASPYMEGDYSAIRQKDKDLLRTILLAYLEKLKDSKDALGNSIISIMIDRTYLNIKEILSKLDSPVDDTKLQPICKANKDLVKALTPDIRTLMILELSWLLSHPNKIKSQEECLWAEKVAELSSIRLRDLTKKLTKQKENIQELSENVSKMDQNDEMRHRIEQLLKVYGISKMMKETDSTSETEEKSTEEKSITPQNGGNRISTKFSIALDCAIHPLFDFIKSKYNPIYGFLESCFRKSHVKKQKILPQLLTLLHISNYFMSSQHHLDKSLTHGIYRIRSVQKQLVQFITSHLQCSTSHINKMTSKKQKDFLNTLHNLFPLRISSLPKQKSVSPLVVNTDIPTVRFMTLNGNITIPPFELFYKKGTETEKEACYQSMTDFFTEDDIYMVYSLSEEIPMNLYEIHFSEIDTSNQTISIKKPITYFSTHHNIHFQDFATIDEHAIYTNTELVLSIFISLKLPITH
jgi:hypothetical protein